MIDMPIATHGAGGAFVLAAWKMATQRHVLRRHVSPGDPVIIIWADEAQKIVHPQQDGAYLAECRSHYGACIYLTQSVAAYYSAVKGRGGEHQTNMLLTNFGHHIFHITDPKTAEYASSLVGKSLQTFIGGSMPSSQDMWETLMGTNGYTGSFNQHYEMVIQPRDFQTGLRMGGPPDYVVDAIVIRSEPFSDGNNFKYVAFSRR